VNWTGYWGWHRPRQPRIDRGDPGIGKSTLMLQICGNLSRTRKVLYISGEESEKQVKLRADRLGISAGNLYIMAENNMNLIETAIKD